MTLTAIMSQAALWLMFVFKESKESSNTIFSLSFLSWTFPLAAGLFIQGEGLASANG